MLITGVGCTLAVHAGPILLLAVAPFALAAFGLLGASAIRNRDRRVDVHDAGVVARSKSGHETVFFEEVDEVWTELDVVSNSGGRRVWIRSLQLTTHDGDSHRIPTTLTAPDKLIERVLRLCSAPLIQPAIRALRAGDELTFGKVRLTKEWIRIASLESSWSDISLARFQAGRVVLLRGRSILPWRIISWDELPHPTVFLAVVKEVASKTEEDNG